MAGKPTLPNPKNPIGGVRRIRKAAAAVDRNLKAVKRWLFAEIDQIPVRAVTVSQLATNDTNYQYQIDLANLRRITRELALRLGGQQDQEVVDQVMAAYQEGTGQSVTNLSTIADDYTRTITQVLNSQPYMRRAALIRSRVFEEMQGFAGDTGKQLGRVLSEAVENGTAPRVLKKSLAERFDISTSRAERIARTEITGALRRARLDEALEARESLGIKTGMLWLSALSPSTRDTHAARHGQIYSQQEVREFYGVDGNGINCKCSQTEILLDADGNPRNPGFVAKVRSQKNN